ncbi:MAG: hypothetical protein R3D57_20150 [Hyphomicrobiaceae bacterium]
MPLAIGTVGIVLVAYLARRDHHRRLAERKALLDGAREVLDDADISLGRDGFPRLDGWWRGRRARVELIPDTLTIRRLPQLWLSVTLAAPDEARTPFAALVRHGGAEFYALAHRLSVRLEPPSGLPEEVVLRGTGTASQASLDRVASALGSILSDARVKEVAATRQGVRLIRQAAEGRRGEHVLLRQPVFDAASVSPGELESALEALWMLHQPGVACPASAARVERLGSTSVPVAGQENAEPKVAR